MNIKRMSQYCGILFIYFVLQVIAKLFETVYCVVHILQIPTADLGEVVGT